jgi:hypothetical protein
MQRSPSLGPTIQSRPDFCPACDGRRIIKCGLRKNSFGIYKFIGQRLRWLLCVFGRTERGQISAAGDRASAVPCTTSGPNMHRAAEWLIKSNSQSGSSRATSTASDLSDEDRKENDYSLEHGFRLLSAYRTNAGDKLWR